LYLGNLDSKRDWGHAKDFVKAMHLMLQQESPDDYIIATGQTASVRDFTKDAFNFIGIDLIFKGNGINEIGKIARIDNELFFNNVGISPDHLKAGQEIVKVDPFYFRPTEVDILVGDSTKAREKLGWSPKYSLNEIIREMVASDIHMMKKEQYLKKGGFQITSQIEDIF
jgi:GDPmannose 4,6-dehydratase